MIVIDASALVEALVGGEADEGLLGLVAGDLAAPHLIDLEVLSAVRGLERGGKVRAADAERARTDLFSLDIHRYAIEPLAERIWQLRHRFTVYDAAYLALAEALAVELLTCDEKLSAPGHHAAVRTAPRSG